MMCGGLSKLVQLLRDLALVATALATRLHGQDLPRVFDIEFRVTEDDRTVTKNIRVARAKQYKDWKACTGDERGTDIYLQTSKVNRGPSLRGGDNWAHVLTGSDREVVAFGYFDLRATFDSPSKFDAIWKQKDDQLDGLSLRVERPDAPTWVVYWDESQARFAAWLREQADSIYVFPDTHAIKLVLGGGWESTQNPPPNNTKCFVFESDLDFSGKRVLAFIAPDERPGSVILQYDAPLFSGVPGANRLVLDLGGFPAGVAGDARFQLMKAAFVGNRDVDVKRVTAMQFDRIASVALHADREQSRRVGSNEPIRPGAYLALSNPLAALFSGRRRVAPITYVAAVNEGMSSYLGNRIPDKSQADDPFNVSPTPAQWVRRYRVTGFSMPEGGGTLRIGDREYATLLKCNRDGSVFVLIDREARTYYLQEFEVTTAQWREFLKASASEQLRRLEESEVKRFTSLTGLGPEDPVWQDRMLLYLWIAVLRAQPDDLSDEQLKVRGNTWRFHVTQVVDRSGDRPMTCISVAAAHSFAQWMGADLPSRDELQHAAKRSANTDAGVADGEPQSLKELRAHEADVIDLGFASVYGLARNVRELAATRKDSSALTAQEPFGLPWWGGEGWGVSAADFLSDKTIDAVTGLRLSIHPMGNDK